MQHGLRLLNIKLCDIPKQVHHLSKRLIFNKTSRNTTFRTMEQQQQGRTTLEGLAASYEQNGYAVLNDFLDADEVQMIRNETTRLIREESRSHANKLQVFGNEFNMKSRYFLDSSDKICYFFEKSAVNLETLELQMPEEQSLAKIAHALHSLNPIFKKVTTSDKIKQVFKAIDFTEPTVVQSMVIFKNPNVGGAYTPHQDASFIYAEPLHVAGIWLALDDATIENGCLEFIPGSHKWPLARRFVRTDNTKDGDDLLEWTAPVANYDESKFVKVPIKRGGLVLIHGLVVHRSAENRSDKSRWAYTFHAYDKAKSRYSDKNWLQINVNDTFMPVYAN
uniref:Phytanoyl-CoA dioxygenase domain-containing protein 1 n=2 Tax=Aceria tosichella TaxID=561515 RepID=A0A6G1SMC9_9ACAR